MRPSIGLALALALACLSGCATVATRLDAPDESPAAPRRLAKEAADRDAALDAEEGKASYYASRFDGRRTASGAIYRQNRLTAAHRTLPFGTRVRVTNLENGNSVVVTINDRGPFKRERVIDVSKRAARELGFVAAGTARVRVEVLDGVADRDEP